MKKSLRKVAPLTATNTNKKPVAEKNVPPLLQGAGEMHLVKKLIRLDIGCGAHPQPGFVGIDVQNFDDPNIIQHDMDEYPWPLLPECVELAVASHVVEHISREKRGFLKFMDEVWRVLVPGGKFMIAVPYAGTPGYWQDPTHCNPVTEHTWRYFDPLDPSGFYKFYRPKPWKYNQDLCSWDLQGFMELVLEKRIEDPSYAK